MRFSTEQMQGPPIPRDEFVAWFVDEFTPWNIDNWVNELSADARKRFTANGVRYANYFGFTRNDLVAQFLYLMWTVGPDFWRFPGFAEVIAHRDWSQERRIDAFF